MPSSPVRVSRQRMSALPSPLKSADAGHRPVEPAEDDGVGAGCPGGAVHRPEPTVLPVVVLRQRMSALPSPLKSATPATAQTVPAEDEV